MWRFDHVGLVVRDLEEGAAKLVSTLPVTEVSQRFDDEGLAVSVQFFRDAGGQVFELIAPLGERSPVSKVAEGKAGKIDQLCYRCTSLHEAMPLLRKAGSTPLGKPKPALAFAGASVQFFWTANEFVLELIEGEGDARRYRPCGA